MSWPTQQYGLGTGIDHTACTVQTLISNGAPPPELPESGHRPPGSVTLCRRHAARPHAGHP